MTIGLEPGLNVVTITATDEAGNETVLETAFDYRSEATLEYAGVVGVTATDGGVVVTLDYVDVFWNDEALTEARKRWSRSDPTKV